MTSVRLLAILFCVTCTSTSVSSAQEETGVAEAAGEQGAASTLADQQIAQLKARLQAAEEESRRQRELAEIRLHALQLRRASDLWAEDQTYSARRALSETNERHRGFEFRYLDSLFQQNQRQLTGDGDRPVGAQELAISRDGKWVAAAGLEIDKRIRIWKVRAFRKQDHDKSDDSTRRSGTVLRLQKHLTLSPNRGFIRCIDITHDGSRIATGDIRNGIEIRDVGSGDVLHTIEAHDSHVEGVAFSPDGDRLVSISKRGIIRIWDTSTGEEVPGQPMRARGTGHCVAFSPDGKWIATGDRKITVWNAETREMRCQMSPSCTRVKSVAFSPDSRRVLSGHWDAGKYAQLWDAETGKELASFDSVRNRVNSVCFNHDGTRVAIGGYDRMVHVCDAATGERVEALQGHEVMITGVEFYPDGTHILSACRSSSRIFELDAKPGPLKLRTTTHGVFSPDGNWVAAGTLRNSVDIRDVKTGDLVHSLGSQSEIVALAFNPQQTQIAVASADRNIRTYDLNSMQQSAVMKLDNPASALAFSPDGNSLLAAAGEGPRGRPRADEFVVWDVKTGEKKYVVPHRKGPLAGVQRTYSFSSDSQKLAISTAEGLRMLNADTGEEICRLAGKDTYLTSLSFSPDGTRVAGAFTWPWAEGQYLKVWDASNGELVFAKKGQTSGWGASAVWSSDSRLVLMPVLTDSGRNGIRVWEGRSGRTVSTLVGHLATVADAAFLPGGSRVVSIGRERGTLKIWHTASGQELLSLPHPRVTWLRTTANGHAVMTINRNITRPTTYTLKIWGTDP